jgi:hypothetical protein
VDEDDFTSALGNLTLSSLLYTSVRDVLNDEVTRLLVNESKDAFVGV